MSLEMELAELGDEFARGVDAVACEGRCPVFVGDAHHGDAAVLVGHFFGHTLHEILRYAELLGDRRGRVDNVNAGQCQAAW